MQKSPVKDVNTRFLIYNSENNNFKFVESVNPFKDKVFGWWQFPIDQELLTFSGSQLCDAHLWASKVGIKTGIVIR